MKRRILASLIATSALIPAPVLAQSSEVEALRQQLAAMQAEMARLTERLDIMEQAEAQSAADIPLAPAAAATPAPTPAPAPAIAFSGAPQITAPGGWSFKLRGRLNLDAGVISAPDSTGRIDGFGDEVRRTRIGVDGKIPGGFGYRTELEFSGTTTEVMDTYLTYSDGGLTITAGQHNTLQGLEELSSSLFTSFMERSAFTDAFGFERRIGLSAAYAKDDVLLQGGVFTDNVNSGVSSNSWGLDGRAVYMPRIGSTQLHLGGSIHMNELPGSGSIRYRQRPHVHFTSERFIDTGSFSAERELGIGLEAAVVNGPFHASAETYWQSVKRPGALADPTFFGGSIEAGYFLTKGDSRGYRKGVFDRTSPQSAVGAGGIGAVQVNLRYDYLDLTDAGIAGGVQNGYQASLIWTLTGYTRVMFDYARSDYTGAIYPAAGGDRDYAVDAFGVRAQIDF